jgi:hypothetical protein
MTQQQISVTNDTELQTNELILHLNELNIQEKKIITARAELELVYNNAGENQSIKTAPYHLFFSCPIQQDDLQWYLNQYHIWPSNTYQKKAIEIENLLMEWGEQLFDDVFPDHCHDILHDWSQSKKDQNIFTVRFGQSSCENYRAVNVVLSQPWYMMNDGYHFFSEHRIPQVLIRSQFPFINKNDLDIQFEPPMRILLINPRPEDNTRLTETDHRSMAKPLFQAVHSLGRYVSIHLLNPPTFLELELTLDAAKQSGQPYHVVHFDGHWDNDPESGLKGFCFENPEILPNTHKRNAVIIDTNKLATCMKSFEIPLVILSTCQHPVTDISQIISGLFQKGVSSVITLPYQLMPETTTHFFTYFYQSIIQGNRISQAMRTGQRAIELKLIPKEVFHDRDLDILDWFVPALIQRNDPQLFYHMTDNAFELSKDETLSDLPDPPAKEFVNRTQELLYIERFLENDNWAVIQAKGGEGKTALAVEMARWFLKTSRVDQIVYVKLNYFSTATSILHQIGDQVLTDREFQEEEWKDYTYTVLRKFFENRTFLICDNMEHTCPNDIEYLIANDLQVIFNIKSLFVRLLEIPNTKILFTTREEIGEPFNDPANMFHLDPLDTTSAIQLIYACMKDGKYHLKHAPEGRPDDDIERLIKLVHSHPLCLKNLAPTIHRRGIQLTIRKISTLMHKLSKYYPDPGECTLAASFELCLQRFPKKLHQHIDNLAVFHNSVSKMIFTQMSSEVSSILGELLASLQSEDLNEMEEEYGQFSDSDISDNEWLENAAQEMDDLSEQPFLSLKEELINHNLAWELRENLILYPGLTSYLKTRLPKNKLPNLKRKWARSMEAFILFMNNRFSEEKIDCLQRTMMELPNIMAFISHCINEKSPKEILEIIDLLTPIFDEIDYEQVSKQMDMIRKKLMEFINNVNDD